MIRRIAKKVLILALTVAQIGWLQIRRLWCYGRIVVQCGPEIVRREIAMARHARQREIERVDRIKNPHRYRCA